MRPILFEVFGIPFASWYVFFALAGVAAYLYCQRLLDASVLSPSTERARDAFAGLFVVCYLAGWFGARAFSVWREQLDVSGVAAAASELMRIGPMTFYGGAIAAALAGVVWAAFKRLPLALLFDAMLPAGILALGIGRIGCHLNGDDFGRAVPDQVHPPGWSVTFPSLGDGVARYPVQLGEAAFSIALAGVAAWVFLGVHGSGRWKRVPSGVLAAVVALLSSAHRFANEFYRGDPRGLFWNTTLSTSQGIALLIFFIAAFLLVWRLRDALRGSVDPAR